MGEQTVRANNSRSRIHSESTYVIIWCAFLPPKGSCMYLANVLYMATLRRYERKTRFGYIIHAALIYTFHLCVLTSMFLLDDFALPPFDTLVLTTNINQYGLSDPINHQYKSIWSFRSNKMDGSPRFKDTVKDLLIYCYWYTRLV